MFCFFLKTTTKLWHLSRPCPAQRGQGRHPEGIPQGRARVFFLYSCLQPSWSTCSVPGTVRGMQGPFCLPSALQLFSRLTKETHGCTMQRARGSTVTSHPKITTAAPCGRPIAHPAESSGPLADTIPQPPWDSCLYFPDKEAEAQTATLLLRVEQVCPPVLWDQ